MNLKKKISAAIASVMTLVSLSASFVGTSAEEAPTLRKVKGDINRDGIVSVSDAVIFGHCLTGQAYLDEEDLFFVDMNNDGFFNVFDMIYLKRTIMGIYEHIYDTESPTEPPETKPIVTTAVSTETVPVTTISEITSPETIPETTSPEITTPETTQAVSETTTSVSYETTTVSSASETIVTTTVKEINLSDMPDEYTYAADWIWNERIMREDSLGMNSDRWNSIFDQICAGEGTLNYVVRWQSYRPLSLEQRQKMQTMIENSINDWAQYLVGYDGWKYGYIPVKIVGWAVIDENVILDKQPDEIIYTDCIYYDSQYDTTNGRDTIPDLLPNAPDELSRMEHFFDRSYQYPGGLDKRFDMYLWGTQGFPDIGGCGGDWGQRLSDLAYIDMLDGTGLHVFEHELGHGFGITDFYGGEGATDGFPPGGFPGNGTSIMMAGSSTEITDFDAWLLRYMWSQIKNEPGRFN